MPKSSPGTRPKFFIIDGHAHIYRAYFAPFRDLTSPTGEPTKATYVFTQMLFQIADQQSPDYLCMVIDHADESVFRKDIDPNYKANREPPPDDFKPQEERIIQLVKDAGIPIYVAPGYEADDLIASIVEKHRGEYDFHLVSKDKDLRQLLNDGVVMYDPQRDETFDADAMHEKLGYAPEQATEVQALMGDNIDNVPGVPGIGEKTAAKLINKYGSAMAVYEHADELTPKQSERVKEHGSEQIETSMKLVTLLRDIPVENFDLEACKFDGLEAPTLQNHLEELGFRTLLQKAGGKPSKGKPEQKRVKPKYNPLPAMGGLFDPPAEEQEQPADDRKYECIDTPAKLKSLAADLKKQSVFAYDTETDDLGAMGSNLVGLSFSWQADTGYYLPVRGPGGSTLLDEADVVKVLKPIFENPTLGKVGHNLKYDQLVLRKLGIDVAGNAADTLLMAFLIDASRSSYKMDSLALDLLGHQCIPIKDLIGTGKKQIKMDDVPVACVSDYAAEDADVTWQLYEELKPKLEEFAQLQALHDEVELPLIDALAEMEFNGIKVDRDILAEQSKVLAGRIEKLREQIFEQAEVEEGGDFNPDSPKQLSEVLFDRLGLKPLRKTKTGYSTDAATLEQLAADHPLPALILEYRGLVKLRETYLENLRDDINESTGRIHTSFNATGASTGRLSSSDPNLQNIPIRTDEGRRIRLAFVADPGNVLLTADYSQIELRMLAHFTEEERLVQAFTEDEDIHKAVAADVYGVDLDDVTREQRGYAKTINFAIIYGVSAFGLARRIDGLTQKSAKELIDKYKEQYPKVFDFFEQCIVDAKRDGFVETIRGRRRPIPEIESKIASMRQYAERTAINSVIQGSAADLMKIAMVNVHRRMQQESIDARLLLTVHDELVFEVPQDNADAVAQLARDEMEGAMELKVPLKVETSAALNWGDAK